MPVVCVAPADLRILVEPVQRILAPQHVIILHVFNYRNPFLNGYNLARWLTNYHPILQKKVQKRG